MFDAQIPNFENARILVCGDVMLDRYWYGEASRISPEAPVPVVHVNHQEIRPGGAANVALNIASLGAKVALLGLVGEDNEAKQLFEILNKYSVHCEFVPVPNFPTITKMRVISQHQQLIRMDFEKNLQNIDDSKLLAHYQNLLNNTDVVILSDYAKGALHRSEQLIELARKQNIPVLVDPKTSDYRRYKNASLVTPNKSEFEAIAGIWSNEEELEFKARKIIEQFNLGGILVTRGKDGMTLVQPGQPGKHFSAKAREVYDVTGAGDTVIGVTGAMLAAGKDITEAVRMANIAAGLVVMKLGAATVSVPELRRASLRQGGMLEGVLTEAELLTAVSDAREHGESIVMTNGCFDILHAGHIQYLLQAKSLGKRLIVVVNDDASVARLKGENRPLNPLWDRMAVLASLRAVDWVTSFSEDTPARLIELVKPDILVKGGDYRPEQIAGAEFVTAHGGQVVILDFRAGCSTTSLINKIQEKIV